jgi:hypothetical protein
VAAASDIVIEIDGKPTTNSVGGFLDTITDFHFGTVYALCEANKTDGPGNASVTLLTSSAKIIDTKILHQNLDVPVGYEWYSYTGPASQVILTWHLNKDADPWVWESGSDFYGVRLGYSSIAAGKAANPTGEYPGPGAPFGEWIDCGTQAAAEASVAAHPVTDLTFVPPYFHSEGGYNSTPAWTTGSVLVPATHHTFYDAKILVKMSPSAKINQFTFNASGCDNGIIRLYIHKAKAPPIINIASLSGQNEVRNVSAFASPGTTSWRAFKDPKGVWHMPPSGNWS